MAELTVVAPPLLVPPEQQEETALLIVSDIHFGKKTTTYNPAVCRRRMNRLADKVIDIKERHLANYDLKELVVCILGDVNDGSEIYRTQPHFQAISNVEEQAFQLSDFLGGWLTRLKESFGTVRVEAVAGNHGLSFRSSMHLSANWDLVAYRYLKLKVPEIPINFDTAQPFIRKIRVHGHPMLLYHGHQIRSFASVPWYGMMLRISRWNTSDLSPFKVAFLGHFHSFGTWAINNIDIFANGSMVTDDEWALQTLGWQGDNRFWFCGVSPKRPITWSFGLSLA